MRCDDANPDVVIWHQHAVVPRHYVGRGLLYQPASIVGGVIFIGIMIHTPRITTRSNDGEDYTLYGSTPTYPWTTTYNDGHRPM